MNRMVISFDLDGTLIDYSFLDAVWFETIPRLYARNHQISFEEASDIVKREYNKIGDERVEWYDLTYWLNKFNLNYDPKIILNRLRGRVKMYEEVPEVLSNLNEYDLIINSNCPREFMEIELEESRINPFFQQTFSSISDFKEIRKTKGYYRKICKIVGIKPTAMIHVGDNWKFDYQVPSTIGIKAIFLDRSNLRVGENIIDNLLKLKKLLKSM